MIPTAIGLPDVRTGVYGAVQDWCQAHGLEVYEPQWRYGEATLPNEWDGAKLQWKQQTIAMMWQRPAPMVWHIGGYYYATKPQIMRNMIPSLPVLREWFDEQDISSPWFMLDEPPHAVKYGWTQQVEDDVVAVVKAAIEADFGVGVAMPGPSQLTFWQERIIPSWWIVNDVHPVSVWQPLLEGARCWLYNAPAFTGLGERLRQIGADGYLHWSGVTTTKQRPLPVMFTVTDETFTVNPAAEELIRELSEPGPLTLDERMGNVERRLDALEARP